MSVIIASYNGARYLGEAIDSALAQTLAGVEILVVDDGSTDDTGAVAARYGTRVRVLRQENRGPSAARNAALRVARGTAVAFLDSDDRFLPDKLARQSAVLEARPDVGVVYTGWRWIDEHGRPFGRPVILPHEGDLRPKLLLGNLVQPVAVVVRRTLLEQVGGFEESIRFNEDWDLFLRLARHGARWASVPSALCEYRVHPSQSTGQRARMMEGRLRVLERAFGDGDLPAALRALRPQALQRAYLTGAAESYRAGARGEGDDLFLAAVRARPAVLTEPRGLIAFCRLLLPVGHQHFAEAVEARRAVTGQLRAAVGGVLGRRDLEAEIGRLRWHARLAVLRVWARLAVRAVWPRRPPAPHSM